MLPQSVLPWKTWAGFPAPTLGSLELLVTPVLVNLVPSYNLQRDLYPHGVHGDDQAPTRHVKHLVKGKKRQ